MEEAGGRRLSPGRKAQNYRLAARFRRPAESSRCMLTCVLGIPIIMVAGDNVACNEL
jgi:D-aminopeptidase